MSLPILDTPFQRDPDSDSSWESSFGLSPGRQAGRQPIPSAFCILNSQSPLSPFQRNVKSSLGGLAWLGSRLDPLPPNCLAGGDRAAYSLKSSQAETKFPHRSLPAPISSSSRLPPHSCAELGGVQRLAYLPWAPPLRRACCRGAQPQALPPRTWT